MIRSDKKTLLHACLPSMKEERILMEFLPHILLHALLEGDAADYGKIYLEMITVINSFTKKHKLDNEVLDVRIDFAYNYKIKTIFFFSSGLCVNQTQH